MSRAGIPIALVSLLLFACSGPEHKYAAEWDDWHGSCVSTGMTQRVAEGDLDETDPELSERYQDTPPSDIPDAELEATFNEIAD